MRWLVAAGLLFVGCESDDPPAIESTASSKTFRVDCLGMYVANNQGGTLVPLLGDDATLSESELFDNDELTDAKERCRYWVSGPFVEGPMTIKNDVSNLQSPRSGTLFIRYRGARWIMRTGEMVLGPTPFKNRATGWYDGTFNGPGGQQARIYGLFEWCEPSLEDCPYKIATEFGKPFQVSTPFGDAWGEANACRVLINRETGGMQADLQIGSWRGVNVGQLWNRACGQDRRATINGNRLTFRAGGVDGPGRYGPFWTTDFDGTLLPHLEWQLPATFWFHDWGREVSFPALCQETLVSGGMRTQSSGRNALSDDVGGPSICEFEIDEEMGEFRLSCSRVIPAYAGSIGLFRTRHQTGELHLTSACDVRYQQ